MSTLELFLWIFNLMKDRVEGSLTLDLPPPLTCSYCSLVVYFCLSV